MKRWKILLSCLITVLFLGLVFAGCGGTKSTNTTNTTNGGKEKNEATKASPSSTKQGKTFLSVGTLGPPTDPYTVLVSLTAKIAEKSNLQINVEPIGPILPQLDLMQKKQIEFGFIDAYSSWHSYRGTAFAAEKGPQPLRQLASTYLLKFGVATTAKSGIRQVADLKGKRVYTEFPSAPALAVYSKALLEGYGVQLSELTPIKYSNSAEVVPAMAEGRADAFFGEMARARMEELKTSVGAYILPIQAPSKAFDLIKERMPYVQPFTIKAGYPGAEVDTPSVGLPMIFYGRADVPDDVVYSVMKTTFENHDELKDTSSSLSDFTDLANATKTMVMPFHNGAIKYFKERGVWTKELENLQEKMLAEVKK